MSWLHMFVKKTCFAIKLPWKDSQLFYYIFSILNSFTNPCTSKTIYCHFLAIRKSVVQIDNPLRSDEEEAGIVIETDQSKPMSHTVAGQSKLVSYTDSSSEEEENLYVEVNFDEATDLAIN